MASKFYLYKRMVTKEGTVYFDVRDSHMGGLVALTPENVNDMIEPGDYVYEVEVLRRMKAVKATLVECAD